MTEPATQHPLPYTKSDWKPPVVADLPDWPTTGRVCVDLETRDPDLKKLGIGVRRGGYAVGFAVAIEDGPSFYLPTKHGGGDNLDHDQVVRYLRDQAKRFRGVLVGANLSYDLDYLHAEGIEFSAVEWFRDVLVAEPLLDELQHEYNLDAVLARHGIPGKDETLLRRAAEEFGVHPKAGLWELPGRFVGAYAEGDVTKPLHLLRRQERLVDAQDLWGVYDLESRVLPVLVAMRRRGVRVDVERLQELGKWAWEQEIQALAEVFEHTAVRIEPGTTATKGPVAKALESVGVELELTKGRKDGKNKQPKITADILDAIDHPVGALLRRAKKMDKLRTTYTEGILKHLVGDRIHCTFNQLRRTKDAGGSDVGPAYGRISASDPNLQNQPIRDPEIQWRTIYIPDEGLEWVDADYSQQEPRMLTHFAALAECRGAWDAVQRYRDNPDLDNHTMMAQLVYDLGDAKPTKVQRGNAKNIYLGMCYGMGPAKLCHDCNLPTEWVTKNGRTYETAGPEGRALFELFHDKAPFVKQLAKKATRAAKRRGYIVTLSGRRCRFPIDKERGGYGWTHKALNRLIQGSSADQTKAAMVAAHEAGLPVQLQIHDELALSGGEDEARLLADIMTNCTEILVPSKVDVHLGVNWAATK